jgi:hypothetical protein
MAYLYRDQMPCGLPKQPLFGVPQWPVSATPIQSPQIQLAVPEPEINWGQVIVGGLALGLLGYAAYKAFEFGAPTRHCSVCESTSHDRRNCPYDGPRISFSSAIPMSTTCECCGQFAAKHRHHTRGRSDDSDFLDLCDQCHLHCGHKGRFQNLPVKPRSCVFAGQAAFWRM